MSAGTLPAIGTKFGPCAEPCNHTDCALTRADAESHCPVCFKPIGYGVRFYMDSEGRERSDGHRMLVHADCAERFVTA